MVHGVYACVCGSMQTGWSMSVTVWRAFCRPVVAVERVRLQPFGRLRDGAHDEGETVLLGLQCGAGTEACPGDHRPG